MTNEEAETIITKTLMEIKQKCFKPGMLLTFIARYPPHPEIEMVISEDHNLEAIKSTLERSMVRERPT